MSENVNEIQEKALEETDTYFNLEKVFSISSIANILSWVFLVFAILIFIPFLIQIVSIPNLSLQLIGSIFSEIVINLTLSVLLLFFFVFLRAISEGLLVLLEIEENTRTE